MRVLGGLVAAALLSSAATTGALACVKCGAPKPGQGCGQLVTLKHPDLKGPERKKEFQKCMSNPGGYSG